MWDLELKEYNQGGVRQERYIVLHNGEEHKDIGMCTRYYIELDSNKLYAMVNGVLYEYTLSSCTHCIIDPLAEHTCTTRTII
jgi:hypothetical protein